MASASRSDRARSVLGWLAALLVVAFVIVGGGESSVHAGGVDDIRCTVYAVPASGTAPFTKSATISDCVVNGDELQIAGGNRTWTKTPAQWDALTQSLAASVSQGVTFGVGTPKYLNASGAVVNCNDQTNLGGWWPASTAYNVGGTLHVSYARVCQQSAGVNLTSGAVFGPAASSVFAVTQYEAGCYSGCTGFGLAGTVANWGGWKADVATAIAAGYTGDALPPPTTTTTTTTIPATTTTTTTIPPTTTTEPATTTTAPATTTTIDPGSTTTTVPPPPTSTGSGSGPTTPADALDGWLEGADLLQILLAVAVVCALVGYSLRLAKRAAGSV